MGAQEKEGSHFEERQRLARSGDGESVEEMARRVDLVSATRRSAGVQDGASGSMELWGAASRSAASPLTARRAARLIERRTAQPAGRRSARASAGSLLQQSHRVRSNVRSEYAWGTATGDENATLHGRLTRLWSRPATGAAPRMMRTATQAQSAGREMR